MKSRNKKLYVLAEFSAKFDHPLLASLENQTYYHKAVKVYYERYKEEETLL